MTEKRFTIVDEQFISYYGGTGHLISNGECKIWLWHSKEESQKVCDKLNNILDENEQLKSIKKFADRNGICIFNIDEAFRRCWRDNAKLVKENEKLRKEILWWKYRCGENISGDVE